MKIFLILILALTTFAARAATGDVTGVAADTNGYSTTITIEGMATNGTYSLGIGTNNSITPKVTFNVVSPGFSTNGVSNAVNRQVFSTIPLRKVVSANRDESGGSPVTIRLVNSEQIYSNDVVSVVGAAGIYTQGGNSNNAFSFTATNSSVQNYPGVTGNWACKDHQLITNTTFELRAMVDHPFETHREPVACVRFVAEDAHGHSNVVFVTTQTLITDYVASSGIALPLYVATMDVTGFTQGDTVTCNFRAYPWVGIASSVLDSATASNIVNTTLAPQYYVNGSDGNYGTIYCVIDPTLPPTYGVATNSLAAAAANPSSAIGYSLRDSYDYSKANFSRTNTDNVLIFVKAGTNLLTESDYWMDASRINSRTWCIVQPYPGVSRSEVIFQPSTTTDHSALIYCNWLKFDNVTFQDTANIPMFKSNGDCNLWLKNCAYTRYAGGSVSPVYNCPTVFAEGCVVTANSNTWPLVNIGNFITNVTSCGWVAAQSANTIYGASNYIAATFTESSLTNATYNNLYFGYNQMFSIYGPAILLDTGVKTYGQTFVNCLFEAAGSAYQPLMRLAGDDSLVSTTNTMFKRCTFAGQRCNLGYDEHGANTTWQVGWHVQDSVFYMFANKNDHFEGKTNGFGNWGISFGVGFNNNTFRNTDFQPEFCGLNALTNLTFAAVNSEGYMVDLSEDSATPLGGGDYRLRTDSQLFRLPGNRTGRWDFEGLPIGDSDAPGVFSSHGNAKKTGGFF